MLVLFVAQRKKNKGIPLFEAITQSVRREVGRRVFNQSTDVLDMTSNEGRAKT